MDYYVTAPLLSRNGRQKNTAQVVNLAGVGTLIASVIMAHYVLPGVISIEVITSCLAVMILYPVLRLWVFRPGAQVGWGSD